MSTANLNWYDGLSKKARRRLNRRMTVETVEARSVIAWALVLTDVFGSEVENEDTSTVDAVSLERLAAALEPYRKLINSAVLGPEGGA